MNRISVLIGAGAFAVSMQAAAAEHARWGDHQLGETFSGNRFGTCTILHDQAGSEDRPTDEFLPTSMRKKVSAYCRESSGGKEKTTYYFIGDYFLPGNRERREAARLYAIEYFFEDDGEGTKTRAQMKVLEQDGAVTTYMAWNEKFNCTVWRFGKNPEKAVDMAIMRYFRHPDPAKNYGQTTLFLYTVDPSEGVGKNFQHLHSLCKQTPFLERDDIAK